MKCCLRSKLVWISFVLSALFMLTWLGHKDIVTSHEARVAQTAREMAAVGWPWSGHTVRVPAVTIKETPGGERLTTNEDAPPYHVNPWLVPVMNGAIRLQKPPLPYWCAAVLYKLEGVDFSEAAARFVPALGAVLSLLLVADLAAMLLNRRAAAIAALVWLSSYFLFDEFRKAMADPYLAFFSLLCVWAWIKASESRGKSLWLLAIFYASFALGSLAKFPVNLLHVGVAILVYHVCFGARRTPSPGVPGEGSQTRLGRVPGPWYGHLLGVILFLLIGMPWPIYVITQVPHVREIWRYESIGEFSDNTEKSRPFFMYLGDMFKLALPWTPMWVVGIFASAMRSNARRRLFATLWFAIELVIFSISNVKKDTYLLPLMPAITLMTVQGIQTMLAMLRHRRGKTLPSWLIVSQIGIGVGWAIAVPLIGMAVGLPSGTARLGVTIALVLFALLPLVVWLTKGGRAWFVTQAIVYAVIVLLFYQASFYLSENMRSAREVAARVATMLKQPGVTINPTLLPEEASMYLPLNLHFNPHAPHELFIFDDPKNELKPDEFFTPQDHAQRIDLSGVIGSQRWKVYEKSTE